MVLTRRMAKLQAACHGNSNARDNIVVATGNGPAQVHTAVCEDAVPEAAELSVPTHGSSNEGNGALKTYISTEDKSTSTGPRSVVSYDAQNTEGTSTYRGRHKAHGRALPLAGPSATRTDGHSLEMSRAQILSAQNIHHGEYHSSPLSSAPSSPTAPRQSEPAKKPRRRKGTRTRWSRTKGQKAKAKGKANEPVQDPKATESTETVANPIEQRIPVEDRLIKRLPQHAVKTAEINEAVRKAEATARKGKWKANPNGLPTTREAQVGCKRARNESIFSIEDNCYPRVDPGPSRTTRRVRQKTVAPSVPESLAPVEAPSARLLRRRRVNILVQPLTVRTKKRKASTLEDDVENKTTKRRKTDLAQHDPISVRVERPTCFEPSARPLGQVKQEQSTPLPYLVPGEEGDGKGEVEDALDVAVADHYRVDLACLSQKLDEQELVPLRTTSGLAEDAIDAEDSSESPPDTYGLSSTINRQELPTRVVGRLPLDPRSQASITAIPTSSAVPAPPPVQYQPPAPLRPEPVVNLRRLVRTLTPAPCPEWFTTTAESSNDMSRASSSEGSFLTTPTSSRFTSMSSLRLESRSLTRSPSPPRERERSMAPEPSDELMEALRAGRVSMCPSPSPTERDTEE